MKEKSNLALYRKYRPQIFKEVEGQDHIVNVLESSIEAGKVSHAYLFVGSRGTGKTSVARIFAKELGVSTNDMYEIDAASNRGIEDIRTLRDGVRVLPFDSKYKVYIIDEVHMLSKDAWGALLKTLEEPPAHVIFILATTEFHKVPETIISRCQVFNFRKPSEAILKDILLKIAGKEGFELGAGSAELLAIIGDGSFRDALGILQKVLNFSKGKKIKREDIEEITGAPKTLLVNNFIQAISEKNLEQALMTIQKTAKEGMDLKLYIKLVIQKFRMAVILKYAPKMEKEMMGDLSEDDLVFLKSLAVSKEMFNSSTLVILLKAYENIDNAFIPELPLEVAIVEMLGE
ncbi:MAG: DNA polymerase III subunit gamma/tau [Candidatus Pacebacteria bacterium]|nr:DNA polymerase III subunit gamma/tau [Candidatus Paceibacterota bacterium]MCF7863083.1 DNA polymerase III subunit gamma/tau [Candidatus Paceibacterota bacterium]